MPSFVNIPLYLQVAGISQYLSQADQASQTALSGGTLNNNYTRLLRNVRRAVQWAYNLNPNDPSVEVVAIYMYQLCGKYVQQALNIIANLAATPVTISGPSNQSVNVGATAAFSVTVTGTMPYTYQWLANGVVIPGATGSTYFKTNAQLSDNGTVYSVQVTNPVGTVTSNVATLTVSASLVGFWYAGNVDYSAQLMAGNDAVPYNGSFSIVNGQPLVVPFPAGQLLYVAVKYPVSQSVKTRYANPSGGLDQGVVPGLALEVNTFGGNNYIFSNTGAPFGINNSTGQCTFS
jgi:hypothetical protein